MVVFRQTSINYSDEINRYASNLKKMIDKTEKSRTKFQSALLIIFTSKSIVALSTFLKYLSANSRPQAYNCLRFPRYSLGSIQYLKLQFNKISFQRRWQYYLISMKIFLLFEHLIISWIDSLYWKCQIKCPRGLFGYKTVFHFIA